MESSSEQRLNPLQADPKPGCGRAGCPCSLPVRERFVLWALRQWQQDRDAFLFGARRAIEIHQPTCSSVSRDEATLVALCGLAQGDFDGPLVASLDVMMAPTASRAAAIRLKAFAVALGSAGLTLGPPRGDSAGRLN
jgi:hypothetical protein